MCDSEMLVFAAFAVRIYRLYNCSASYVFFNGLLVCMHVRLSECRQQIDLFIVQKLRRQILLPLKVYD